MRVRGTRSHSRWPLATVTAIVMLLVPVAADVDSVPAWQWVTDAEVTAAASIDRVVYLGGTFRYIGAVSAAAPSFVELDTGLLAQGCATQSGMPDGVHPVVVADTGGALFMQVPSVPATLVDAAGSFAVPAAESFVRIGADCRFDRTFRLGPFIAGDAATRGESIARVASTIYVAGSAPAGFGNPVARVVAFSAAGVPVNSWQYEQFGAVSIEGTTAAGQLVVLTTARSSSDGVRQAGVLAPETGSFVPLGQGITASGFAKVTGTTLYISPAANTPLRAIDLATGLPKAGWTNPIATVSDLEVAADRVFIAGSGLGRSSVFAVAEDTGALVTSFAPALTVTPGVAAAIDRLDVAGTRLVVRGRTVRALEGVERYLLAAVSTTSGASDPWAPLVFAPTNLNVDLIAAGSRLYIGRVRSPQLIRRQHLAAVNTRTGVVLPFDPNGAGGASPIPPVTALATDGDYLFAGTSQSQIRRVSLATGLSDSWAVVTAAAGVPHGYVAALAVIDDILYAGGHFISAFTSAQSASVSRGHGLAVDIASGQLTNWDPRVSSPTPGATAPLRPIAALSVADTAMILGGAFTAAGGAPRVGLAAVDLVAGNAVLPGLTLPAGERVSALATAGTQTYFAGVGARAILGVVDTVTEQVTHWDVPSTAAPSEFLSYRDGIVYAGAAWNPETGMPLASNPITWSRPAAVAEGLLELQAGPHEAAGPVVIRFHTAGAAAAPTAPRNLTVQYATNQVYLTWTAPTIGDVESYIVRAGPSSGEFSLANFDTGSRATTLLTLAAEGVYYVRVHARGPNGVTQASNEVAFALAPFGCNAAPRAPTGLSGVGTEDGASLTWGPAIGAVSYVIEAGSAPGTADLAVLPAGAATVYQTSAPPGTYFVRVRGANACGRGPASNETVLQVGGPVPDPPSALRAVITGSSVQLLWAAPTTGTVPSHYRLEAGNAPGLSNLAQVNAFGLSYDAAGVAPGTYYVRVHAANATGASQPTADVIVVVGQ